MKYVLILIGLAGVFGAGWCTAAIPEAVASLEHMAAIRDADEDSRARKRDAWKHGELFANTTVRRKSRIFAEMLPPGFSLAIPHYPMKGN